MEKRKITVEIERATASKTYESNCNAYTITRKTGTAPVSVNNYPLDEGEAKTYGGNIGDLYTDGLRVVFGTGTKELFIERRFEN